MSDDDMPVIGGLLTALIYVMIPVIVFCILFPNLLIYLILQGIFVVLTSIYIIVDTRFILEKLSLDDYIIGALMLYVDVVNLFLYLLAIFGVASGG
jgi:FtsH-binding integral membrane protein